MSTALPGSLADAAKADEVPLVPDAGDQGVHDRFKSALAKDLLADVSQ